MTSVCPSGLGSGDALIDMGSIAIERPVAWLDVVVFVFVGVAVVVA